MHRNDTMRAAAFGSAILSVLLVAACGDAGKQNQAAYDACLTAAKASAQYAGATFEAFDRKMIGASAGDEGLRVSIPYELNGQKNVYQCIAEKQSDGTYKAVF